MAGYISLIKFTPQGVSTIKNGPERIANAKSMAGSMGVRVVGVWWTLGEYDGLLITDAPDDQTATAFILTLAGQGNITTQTMRAFSEAEIQQVVSKIP